MSLHPRSIKELITFLSRKREVKHAMDDKVIHIFKTSLVLLQRRALQFLVVSLSKFDKSCEKCKYVLHLLSACLGAMRVENCIFPQCKE